jgi:hypothetical protein
VTEVASIGEFTKSFDSFDSILAEKQIYTKLFLLKAINFEIQLFLTLESLSTSHQKLILSGVENP